MPLTKDEIKKFHDKGYSANQPTRDDASDDIVFAFLSQWDDPTLDESDVNYRGQFDITRPAIRGTLAQLAAQPVTNDFYPKDEDNDTGAELLDGLYRADNQNNTSIEARESARQQMVVCGFGAYEIFTEYESYRSEGNNQVLRRRPIPEANNTVFYDPDANLMDKSDAIWCSMLTGYTDDGYKDLAFELTGEEKEDINPVSFDPPNQSLNFYWIESGTARTIYVSTFYHKELVETKILYMVNPVGQPVTLYEDDLKGVMDDMIDEGYEIEDEKKIKRWRVTKYIVSGEEILNGEINDKTGEREGEVISGEYIPIIPMFGEYAIVEGQEHWEGVVRLAKDPQRLHNFVLSYVGDIASKSPIQKPIMTQEQIGQYGKMYENNGPDNNYTVLLQESKGADGRPLPIGPQGALPATPVPPALPMLIDLTRQAVEDVANPGAPKDLADADLTSSKAINAMTARIDMQIAVYRDHAKHAERYDGVVAASIYAEIYDVPRPVSIELKDGTRKKVQMMERVIDSETGDIVMLNDINNKEFEVFSKIGPSYGSQKEQTRDQIKELLQGMNPADPKYDMLLMQYLSLMDGADFDDTRDYIRKEQIKLGYRQPETDEEKQMLAEIQNQPKEPSAEMLVGLGEKMKGEAALLEQKRKGIEMQLEFQNKDTANKIDGFEAQTKRMEAQIEALQANADINMKNITAFSKQVETKTKLSEFIQPVGALTDEALMAEWRAAQNA